MVSKALFLLGALVATVSAAPRCRAATTSAAAPAPTLPSTGATDLPAPAGNVVLKRIALGHGIQNYTCSSNDQAKAAATGALAVLYDVTALYPGTPGSGLSAESFSSLPTTILWTQPLPLNLQDPAAAAAATSHADEEGSPSSASPLPESAYGAIVDNPFPDPTDLLVGDMSPIKYLGHHYFDIAGVPTFDLRSAGASSDLFGRVAKADNVPAPGSADSGILGTGAVDWLRLVDDGSGKSDGIAVVYRVATAGGVAEACSSSGVGEGSVPYAAMYWFYG